VAPVVHKTKAKAKAKPKPMKQWELIVSQSSCDEQLEAIPQPSIDCSIGVKNRGTSAGLPTVYAIYFYNDSDKSYDESDNGQCAKSDPIRPGQLGYVYFCHTYRATQHDLTGAAVSLDLSARKYPYVRVMQPDDPNWPSS